MKTINIKKIRPLFSAVVTTMEKYEEDNVSKSGLIVDPSKRKGTLREYQRVVAVGEFVKNIKEGDLVCIDPKDYAVYKYAPNSVKNDIMQKEITGYNFNTVDIAGVPHLILKDRDITFIVEDFDPVEVEEEKGEVKEPSPLVTTPSIIIP